MNSLIDTQSAKYIRKDLNSYRTLMNNAQKFQLKVKNQIEISTIQNKRTNEKAKVYMFHSFF